MHSMSEEKRHGFVDDIKEYIEDPRLHSILHIYTFVYHGRLVIPAAKMSFVLQGMISSNPCSYCGKHV